MTIIFIPKNSTFLNNLFVKDLVELVNKCYIVEKLCSIFSSLYNVDRLKIISYCIFIIQHQHCFNDLLYELKDLIYMRNF